MIRTLLIAGIASAISIQSIAQESVLPGRPDAEAPAGGDDLGQQFSSLAAGVSFRPPAGMQLLKKVIGDEDIVQYADDKRQWLFKLSRIVLSTPAPLETTTEKVPDEKSPDRMKTVTKVGMLDSSSQQFQMDMGGAEILRQDFVNIADLPVGRLAARYKSGPDSARMTQRAIIQASEKLYYVFDLSSPAPREGDVSLDPRVKEAVNVFNHVLDSVKLLDQSSVMQDQTERLFRTRAALVNLTEDKLRSAVRKEQWLLIMKNGKPLGYTYIVERIASDIPRTGQGLNLPNKGGADGVLIGVRSRMIPETGKQVDAETWQWMSFDRKHEVWSNLAILQEADPVDKTRIRKERVGEFGSSDATVERIVDKTLEPGEKRGDGSVDEKQPNVRQQEIYTLNVTPVNRSGENQPITRQLPPFYASQAMGSLLPRLLSKSEGKTYLFAQYISERKEVLKRFIDVGTESQASLGGRSFRAIPVSDRTGLEGASTIHYISPSGDYLGSENKHNGIVILASDAATLEKLFGKPDLTAPAEVGQ
jgi:hypothetical protein